MEQQRHVRNASAGPAPLPGGSSGAQVQQPAAAAAEPQQEASGGQAPRRRQLYDDDFMIWVWKIEMCKRTDQHDRKECPYAHPGELARRRHPSLYQALPCPEARAKKICPRLENCNCSHSTFEFWLHPDRYKTFPCERGEACDRPICFFAHSPAELRELPQGMQRTTPAPRPPPQAATGSSSGSSGRLTGPGSQQSGAGPSRLYAAPGPSHIAGAGPSSSGQHYPRSGPPLQQYPAQYPAQHRGQASSNAQQGGGSRQQGSYQQPMYPGAMQQEAGSVMGGAQEPHRGPTVAVIPAGRSVWQNNSALQSESGEAPNLEELCAAVTRMAAQQAYQGQPHQGQQYQGQPQSAALSAALQQQQQQQQHQHQHQHQQQQHQQRQQHQQHLRQHQHHQQPPYQHQHRHQHQQPGLPAASAMPPSQYPYPMMRVPQVLPSRVPLSGYPAQQRQQQPGQQPMQQQVMLPGGQVVYMQMVPPGEPGAADQVFWGGLPRH